MGADEGLRSAVTAELARVPDLDAGRVAVHVADGAVTLAGIVENYFERVLAVEAAERVPGVRAVADEIEVRLPAAHARDDSAVAEAVARALAADAGVPAAVEAEVALGLVTLRGTVESNAQAEHAKRVVQGVAGVRGVTSALELGP